MDHGAINTLRSGVKLERGRVFDSNARYERYQNRKSHSRFITHDNRPPNVRAERLCPPRSSWYQTDRRAGKVRSSDKLGSGPDRHSLFKALARGLFGTSVLHCRELAC